jgi:hypothetical protein
MQRSHRHRLALAGLTLGLLTAACSSDSKSADRPVADSPSGNSSGSGTPGDATTLPGAPVADGDICAAVPALDVINAQLDEPVTGVRRLERGPGIDLCEAAGDGVANAQFTRVADSSREQVTATATELGYTPTDLADPALPGAITYAGAVSVFVDGTEYTVQTITMDTVSDPASPLAAQRSAALLVAWLQVLGVTL